MQHTSSFDEKILLSKVAGGDEIAFRQLFLHWHQLLAGYVLRITKSREMTEEIVQDVFLKIWMTRETLPAINQFKHYLLVVSRNQAYDALKKQLKERGHRQTWEIENAAAYLLSHPIHPGDNNPSGQHSSLIDEAIDSLPARRKEVYLLSRHERLSYQEIADRLGISKESVKTHLQLATTSITTFIRSRLPLYTLLFFISDLHR